MRIAILADAIDDQYAGVYTYASNLIRRLVSQDKKNEYVFIHLRKNEYFQHLNHQIVPDIPWIPFYGMYRMYFKIPKILRKMNVDVVHSLSHFGPFLFGGGFKKILTVHDCTPLLFPQFHVWQSVLVHRLFWRRILKNTDRIIAVSPDTKNDLLRLFPFTKGKVEVVLSGVDQNKTKARKLQNRKKYILFVGTIEPRKNISLLVDAYDYLKSKYQIEEELYLVGKKGWKTQEVEKKINQSPCKNNIVQWGFVSTEELEKLYINASIFVYPSLYEGFGLPPLEAMQHGIPVVLPENPGLRCIAAQAAYVYKNNSVEELAIALYTVLRNEQVQNDLIQKGKELVKQFTWEKTAENTITIYNKQHGIS